MIKKLVLAFGAELSAMNFEPSVPVGLPKKVTYPLGIAAGVYGTYKLRQHLQGDPQKIHSFLAALSHKVLPSD
jgi:hypothetical protein